MTLSPGDWLALREPADATARSTQLTRAIAERLLPDRPVRILDLATGTGSNVRYLSPLLAAQQDWLITDRNPSLLAEVPGRTLPWSSLHHLTLETRMNTLLLSSERREIQIDRQCVDLSALDLALFQTRDLVTASALLDLVSEDWLQALAGRCAAAGALVLFALTYDGTFECAPAEPEDATIRDLMNRHQKTNNVGFGPAEGPAAIDYAARSFEAAGYEVRRSHSDWVLEPDSARLQQEMIEGWAQAAAEMAPNRASAIQAWMGRRLEHVAARRSRIIVGHEDLAGWPAISTGGDPTPAANWR